MPEKLPKIYLVRHGETEWAISGKHTGRTDIELTERGKRNASDLGERLGSHRFEKIISSPLIRARATCELAGFTPVIDPEVMEWHYGDYEGMLSSEIKQRDPDWNVFFDGCPNGESPEQVTERALGVLAKLESRTGDVAIFSHGHFLRALAGCWLAGTVEAGRQLLLSPGAVCILSYDHHSREERAIELWNDVSHIRP